MAEQDLYFFNKEGDYLNFNFNQLTQRWEGDILFHENSNDTFKTVGIYTLENVPSFEFELVGQLTTRKFQLFNEYGFHFYGNKNFSVKVKKIEPVNNDPSFYTKWIYGDNFESLFPKGTLIKFDSPVLEFVDPNRTYCVISSKKDAIMVVSQMDNSTFEFTYYVQYSDPTTYTDVNISGINAVGVYHYINNFYENNLSNWSEPNFYDMVYVGKKLNVLGSEKNNDTFTINNVDLTDQRHFEYFVNKSSLPTDTNLIIEIKTKTDVPLIYEGQLDITSDNRIFVDFDNYPDILKPGMEFKIIGSTNNTNFYTVAPIPTFETTTTQTYYATGSQVLFENGIRQCVTAYTHSYVTPTWVIEPTNTDFWGPPTYIKVEQSTVADNLMNAQLYLTSDRYYFEYGWTNSAAVTLASAAEKYKEDLSIFDVDLFYENNQLKADLVYASDYTEVNFYHTSIGSTYSIGSYKSVYEKIIGVSDNLTKELNYNYSSNFKINVIFTDLDMYGIKISINGMVYDIETIFVYSGQFIDMERTIDRTLRNWLTRYFVRLYSLGIIAELYYTGSFTSVFYNSIRFRTEYPNVPMLVDYIRVGDTAAFYIEHTKILFNDLGPYLEFTINDDTYGINTIYGTGSQPNINATLQSWADLYSLQLIERGIIVKQINNLILFDVTDTQQRLDYKITTGKINLPGINDYTVTKKLSGSEGVLIASNEVVLPSGSSFSFEQEGFATGMAFSINNTAYPFNNQEYVIEHLDPTNMNLSYQGPFWGLEDAICNSSAFITLAFSIGFGQTACVVPPGPTGGIGGPFDSVSGGDFNPLAFSLAYSPNSYAFNNYNYTTYPGTSNLVDLIYVQLSNSILLFGDDLIAIDSYDGDYLTTVTLPGNTQSIELEYNIVNDYLYCLSKYKLYVVDTVMNSLISTISLTASNSTAVAFDMEINPQNGDVYVTYENLPRIDIFAFNNLSSTPTTTISPSTTGFPVTAGRTGRMVFNSFEGDMYVTTDVNEVVRINSNRTVQTTYGITGLTHSIFYEPVFESVYVYSTASLWRIDNGITQSLAVSTGQFNDILFNNLTSEMNLSTNAGVYRLDLSNNAITQIQATAGYGYLALNQHDGDLYVSTQGLVGTGIIKAIDPVDGTVKWNQSTGAPTTKIIYNPERRSVWALQPTINSVAEVQVTVNGAIIIENPTYSVIEDFTYGTLDPNYVPRESIWLKTREYFRRPRENFEGDVSVKYYWRWITDEVKQFFMYDFSGTQLSSTGSYAYIGEKPLKDPVLNRLPNKDITKVSYSSYQQTIFDRIEYTLSYVDDSDDTSVAPEALELFVGFKSEEEGALRNVLQLYKSESIQFNIISDEFTNLTFTTVYGTDKRGEIYINQNSSETFTGRGLKPGQHLVIYVKDDTNKKNQYISNNNAVLVKVRNVYTKYLVVDFFNYNLDILFPESTVIQNYPSTGSTTYLKCTFKVKDREIGRFITYGQTEEEDIRFKVELGNVGKLINPDEVFIFKDYDINEGGIDWIFLNQKRKEMLMNNNQIYPYIGSYKSLINAINYFGYNDLQLNEYYRNVNPLSKLFGQLYKIEIPDIFDNTIKGWNEKDFIKHTMPNSDYEQTKMFNLTYFITDFDGNYVLNYSLDEVIIKLQGLKYWLKRNIIPLTHKIMDITGRSSMVSTSALQHQVYDISIFKTSQEMTPVTFRLDEAYLSPVNSGSTVYNCVIEFLSIIPGLSEPFYEDNVFDGFKPYNGAKLVSPDYFNVRLRTYKTYKEWAPFTTYEKGDKVIYYDLLYESVIDNNKVKDPRKFQSAAAWSPNDTYVASSIVQYQNDFYVYSGLGATSSLLSPNVDPQNWLKVTEWKRINLEPVQTITEYRQGDDLKPFNITVDSNIDPFIVVEVISDNGYGQIYTDKKSYYIKGLKDLVQSYTYIDPIGPFTPITPVY